IRCTFAAARIRCQRSILATGSPVELTQFLRTQPVLHRVMPSLRYWLSVCRTTSQGRLSDSSAAAAAVSSIRLLVVLGSAPDSSLMTSRYLRMAAHPPGPGLGLQPPSVQISTTLSG